MGNNGEKFSDDTAMFNLLNKKCILGAPILIFILITMREFFRLQFIIINKFSKNYKKENSLTLLTTSSSAKARDRCLTVSAWGNSLAVAATTTQRRIVVIPFIVKLNLSIFFFFYPVVLLI